MVAGRWMMVDGWWFVVCGFVVYGLWL